MNRRSLIALPVLALPAIARAQAFPDRAITLVEQTGSIQETMRRARAYADAAKAALAVMPDSDIKRALTDIADLVFTS